MPGSSARGGRSPARRSGTSTSGTTTRTAIGETRIIFIDTEKSNWTWDEEAKAYYWHRFYAHQPDLNFDNPAVMAEVKRLLHYWLDMGVDGLRLDAIPYLVERDGTNNENLPETHAVLKELRAEMDRYYPDRMFLAEANQWPEDTRPYFGDGDECHMAFHFPLMPRMYMAVAQEDRNPITDIIRQTPDIPENCQWAIFLRNHDELTLEMVTSEERDYLWSTYAKDRRARINLGIRRRLAPLMDNDRRKIELMDALLMSMPGTPVVYYGDEIGMGDNYYLGDRDGVRTPMQWSGDRNGGFSRANPQALYLPAIMDPVYGFEAVNVEAAEGEANSLLNWMRRLIAVRKQHRAFGRGSFNLLYPTNRKILAYVREHEDERILCVFNLSRQAQAVEIDLSPWRGAVPIELTGGEAFPPAGDLPYLLTLPAYGFFWFLLADAGRGAALAGEDPGAAPRIRHRHRARRQPCPGACRRRRAAAPRALRASRLHGRPALVRRQGQRDRQGRGDADRDDSGRREPASHRQRRDRPGETKKGEAQRYLMPLSVLWGEENLRFGAPKLSWTLAKIRTGPKVGAIVDASYDERFHRDLIAAMREGKPIAAEGGTLRLTGSDALRGLDLDGPLRSVGVEQSNVSFIANDRAIVKIYRRLRDGEQPEIAVSRFLTETAGFRNTPAFLGAVRIRAGRWRAGGACGRLRLRAEPGRRVERDARRAGGRLRRPRRAAGRQGGSGRIRPPARSRRRARPADGGTACGLRHPDHGPGVPGGSDHGARRGALDQGGDARRDPRPRHRQGGRPWPDRRGEGRCGGADEGAEGDPRPRLRRGRAAGRGPQDAHPRRLPSRPGAGGARTTST